jgi:predicted PurR-regulated permease PerM
MIDQLRKLPVWLRLTIFFPLAFLNGWLLFLLAGSLEPMVSILITASLLAFLLEFPISFLERKGVRRTFSIFIVLFLTLVLVFIFSTTVFPLLVRQLNDLISTIPSWLDSGTQHIQELKKWAITQRYSNAVKGLYLQIIEKLSGFVQVFTSQFLSILLGAINSVIHILIVMVLTVFLVLNGSKIWHGIFSWVPQPWDVKMQTLIRQTFRSYFATQAILAGILSIAQVISLTILEVPYALLFGICIGTSVIIPFGSLITISVISILVSLNNLMLGLKVFVVAIALGQVNDQILLPRLMGHNIGLNPVWLIVSLFIGGKFGGLLGLIIAVPLASIIKSTADEFRTRKDQEILG